MNKRWYRGRKIKGALDELRSAYREYPNDITLDTVIVGWTFEKRKGVVDSTETRKEKSRQGTYVKDEESTRKDWDGKESVKEISKIGIAVVHIKWENSEWFVYRITVHSEWSEAWTLIAVSVGELLGLYEQF